MYIYWARRVATKGRDLSDHQPPPKEWTPTEVTSAQCTEGGGWCGVQVSLAMEPRGFGVRGQWPSSAAGGRGDPAGGARSAKAAVRRGRITAGLGTGEECCGVGVAAAARRGCRRVCVWPSVQRTSDHAHSNSGRPTSTVHRPRTSHPDPQKSKKSAIYHLEAQFFSGLAGRTVTGRQLLDLAAPARATLIFLL